MDVGFCQMLFLIDGYDQYDFFFLWPAAMDYMSRFLKIELALHIWNKLNLVMVHNLFTYCWI